MRLALSVRLQATLKERGYRLTPQRRVILEALERARHHTTADDIARRVSDRFPGIDASTVYRTLQLLEENGLVNHTHFDDDVTRWHLASERAHQHLVCRACGEEQELELDQLDALGRRLRDRFGFDADLAHFAIAGVCRACRHRPDPTA
jgi:Fur family transcriptional regulator, ferric uptake regulator